MRIGDLVKWYIPKINAFCEEDSNEFKKLQNLNYCRETFEIGFPFYKEVDDLMHTQHVRFWVPPYIVRGKTVRVTSQWAKRSLSRSKFIKYLILNNDCRRRRF